MREEHADRSHRVIVVGSINVDLVVRAPALPRPGETVVGGTFERHGGGKSANQAVAAARAGARVAFVGAVGDDEAGRAAVAELAGEGIDTGGVAVLAGTHTGIASIVVGPDGENQIAVASGANGALAVAHVEAALADLRPRPGDVCLVGFEVPLLVVRAAAAAAHAAGATLIVNPAPAPAAGLDDGLCRLGPILTPNRGEAAALTRASDPAEAARLLAARTGAAVVVTLGAEGALIIEPDGSPPRAIPASEVTPVDTTGAGDAFNGTLAASLAAGRGLVEAAGEAVAAASAATTRRGAR